MSSAAEQHHLIGLLGFPLGHSFSAAYFNEKFRVEKLSGWEYRILELNNIDGLKDQVQAEKNWLGFNVTIPHKKSIIPFLDSIDPLAARIGAVNTVKILPNGQWRGFNTDYEGLKLSLLGWLPASLWKNKNALIIGNGGAAAAAEVVLQDLKINHQIVSRNPRQGQLHVNGLNPSFFRRADLILQCTPLGMAPDIHEIPPFPKTGFRKGQRVLDLIYNPEQTLFLQQAEKAGAKTRNGLAMLLIQAEKAWEIWTSDQEAGR